MKKVLFVITSHDELGDTGKKTGYYLSEVSHPYYVLTDKGFDIDFVSPKGGDAPVDGVKLEDPLNKRFIDDPAAQEKVKRSFRPDDIDPAKYDAIYYAGGHGTMWDFPDNKVLADVANKIYESGGVVSAVCHGPAGLVNIKLSSGSYLVDGKRVAAFSNEEEKETGLEDVVPFLLEDKLKERGAEYTKGAKWTPHVEISERLVTGQNPQSAMKVAEGVAALLS